MTILPHAWHGQGPPLVLVSGLGGKGTSWHLFLERAAAEFRVLTFDNRGAGLAPRLPQGATIQCLADDTLRLLDHARLERAALVGRSMGGMIAQELALRAPDRIERLVLVSTTARSDVHLSSVFELWAEMAEQRLPAGLRHRQGLLWCLGREALEDEGRVRSYLEWKRASDRPDDYAIQARACARHDALARLPELRVPTLVVSGTDDRLTPCVHAATLAKAIPGARLAHVPGAGHLPYLEKPNDFANLVLEFLASGTGGI